MPYTKREPRAYRSRVHRSHGATVLLAAAKRDRGRRATTLAVTLILLLLPSLHGHAEASVLRQIQMQHDGISLENVTAVAVSPDGKHVYAAQELPNHHSVTVLARNAATGALTYVETHSHWTTDDPSLSSSGVTFISGFSNAIRSPGR
jgi:hypothetical protein